MKHLKLLLFLFLLLAVKNLEAAETEPNNTKGTANALALNGSNTGAINIAGDEDWWKVTTTGDGKLDVTINVSNGQYLSCYIYDNNGTVQLSYGYTAGTATVSKDGLAAGAYYIKLIAYYSGQMPSYTISNTLTQPVPVNDVEPNNTKAQAISLPLNGGKTGHVGYYYNNQSDTSDWYKVIPTQDGMLRLSLTPANGKYVYVYLYDNDGTTLLSSGYSTGAFNVSKDGLAAGTYYVRVQCYYSNDFAPYTLSDSLFTPSQTNDAEPNDTKEQAKILPLNGSKTGHTGYYYNVQRDTLDWYKVSTAQDGLLRLSLTPASGQYVYVYLYDNDGTTLLNSGYSTGAFNVSKDGLAAGTYYVCVRCYYSNGFAPYTLSDSSITYNYAADQEPNKRPYQAKTIPANGTATGYVNFYYNKSRDTLDWWKINYTGNGNLSFAINQEAHKIDGGYNYLYFQVYKDTAATPIYSGYSAAASWNVNLTALTQGYYWIKLYTYYTSEFVSYSFTNTFTQVGIATIKATAYDTLSSCASTNSIAFQPKGSSAPYKVQLYRFGTAYGNPVITSKKITFKNLPTGSYYATVYGDGATGTAFGKSKIIAMEPVPSGLNTTSITSTKAKLNWTAVTCAAYYTVQYKVYSATVWITKKTTGNVNNYMLSGLVAGTTYDWRIATSDSANKIVATGIYTDSISFTTTASLIADPGNSDDNLSVNNTVNKSEINSVMVYPNPATSYFVISYNNDKKEKVNAQLFDMSGKAVWSSGLVNSDVLNGKQVPTAMFAKGIFYLKIMSESGQLTGTVKVVIL